MRLLLLLFAVQCRESNRNAVRSETNSFAMMIAVSITRSFDRVADEALALKTNGYRLTIRFKISLTVIFASLLPPLLRRRST